MTKQPYSQEQLKDLLLQMMETELGGEQVYRAALKSVQNTDLKKEWTGYLNETITHQNVVRTTCELLNIDADEQTPTREVVKHIGASLVKAIELAQKSGNSTAAQLVACECVVHAETKDHLNWELLGKVAKAATGSTAQALTKAYEIVENDEDHHYYHTRGWCRELWIENLGLPAVLPPPEETKQVETAIGAARAEQERDRML